METSRSRYLKPPTVDVDIECSLPTGGAQTKRRYSLSKPVDVIRAAQLLKKGRRFSLQPITQSPALHAQEKRRESMGSRKGERRRSSVGGWGTGGPFAGHMKSVKSRKFSTHNVDSLTEEEDNESSQEDDTNVDSVAYFGEELYLAEEKCDKSGNLDTFNKKLPRLKSELQARRDQRKCDQQEQATRRKPIGIPSLPPLDMEAIVNQPTFHYSFGMPDELPTFEEFIKLLHDENLPDPRYRSKTRKKTKRVAQRYSEERPVSQYNISGVSANTFKADPSYFRIHAPGQKPSMSSRKGSSQVVRDESSQKLDRSTRRISMAAVMRDRWQYADDVLAVTNSEPCKEHWLKQTTAPKGKETLDKVDKGERERNQTPGQQYKSRQPASVTPISTPDVLLISPTGNSEFVHHGSKSTISDQTPPMFPKLAVCDIDEVESPDTETDESESETDKSSFDSNKLNLKYSIERLRKKRRIEKKNKKPVFYDVLRKYYRMQAALKLFSKESSVGNERPMLPMKTRRMALANLLKANEGQRVQTKIGSLKKFPFLDMKRRKRINLNNVSTANFTAPDIERFDTEVEAALDHFVVRREIVVSGISSRCATSVTFTKKSAFHLKLQDNKNL